MKKSKKETNTINPLEHISYFKNPDFMYSVSGRNIRPNYELSDYLKIYFPYINLSQIESVFGSTTDFSNFYGGRTYKKENSLTEIHIKQLKEMSSALSLTFTNHFFDQESYTKSQHLLEKHHQKGNTIICVNDELANQINKDFPLYKTRASIIKNLNTIQKIEKAYESYDQVVIPMDKNDDDDFLFAIPEKERVTLFANANCAYTCPARTCYLNFSKGNRNEATTETYCSKNSIDRLQMGFVYFDVKKFGEMGYRNFKLIPLITPSAKVTLEHFTQKKIIKKLEKSRPINLCSFPKSGRTWLRIILANYINLYYKLGLQIDLQSFFSIIPNNSDEPIKGKDNFIFHQKPEVPFILCDHSTYKPKRHQERKTIFLFRSIPDTLVSYYFHLKYNNDYNKDIKSFIRDGEYGIERLIRYYKSWIPELRSKDIHLLSYEQLKTNTKETVREILTFVNVEYDTNLLDKAITLSSFENLQNMEKIKGIPGTNPSQEIIESNRFRKGKTGDYKQYLDENDIQYIDQTIALDKDVKGFFDKQYNQYKHLISL